MKPQRAGKDRPELNTARHMRTLDCDCTEDAALASAADCEHQCVQRQAGRRHSACAPGRAPAHDAAQPAAVVARSTRVKVLRGNMLGRAR